MPYLISASIDTGALEVKTDHALTIGRAKGNGLILNGSKVSRRHAELQPWQDQFILKDLGSSYGTKVNGDKLEAPVQLAPGDKVEIGGHNLVFSLEKRAPQPAKKAAPPPPPRPAEHTPIARDAISKRFAENAKLYTDEMIVLKRRIHEAVLIKLNLSEIATKQIQDEELKNNMLAALDQVLREFRHELPRELDHDLFRQTMIDELVGFGPIEPMLRDSDVDEVMVNGPDKIFVERKGQLYETGMKFFDDRHLITIIQRVVEPLGRHVDEASPMVDARLPDGSRVNAIIPPLALDGPSVTVRKFATHKLTTKDLIKFGSMTDEISLFLEEAVRSRMNILVSGGTGSGKTTLLNVLSLFIPQDDRVVTIEDSAELKLSHRNLVRLESRPANIEGKGRVAIRDLVINSLRMRPDRIIVGECRGSEALDMLQAMNTGHDGSLTTVHANNPRDALSRLENMVMMAGYELPSKAIREQIGSAINLVVQQARMVDGSRKITQISEITGRESDMILMQDIFTYEQEGYDEKGKITGKFVATGNIPSFVEHLKSKGDLRLNMGVFVPRA